MVKLLLKFEKLQYKTTTGEKLLPFCCQVELGQKSWSASHWAEQSTRVG